MKYFFYLLPLLGSLALAQDAPSDPSETPGACECDDMFCAQSYPQSCYCSNNNKKKCYEKCGGAEPEYQVCEEPSAEPAPSSTMETRILPIVTPSLPIAPPSRTHAACGGFRGNYQQCPPTEMCVKDPYRSGCGPACDQPGICVSQVRCSTRLGIPCPQPGQACVALPDCDPARGGQNCMGVCVYPH